MSAVTRFTPIEELPQYLTIEEFCAFMAIGRSCAYELVRTGKIESVRFGKLVRIPRRALERDR